MVWRIGVAPGKIPLVKAEPVQQIFLEGGRGGHGIVSLGDKGTLPCRRQDNNLHLRHDIATLDISDLLLDNKLGK